jgi:hypothetical protein
MSHILARIKGAKLESVRKVLKADEHVHANAGLRLQRLWQNVDDSDEVWFLFYSDDLKRARQFIDKVHKQALDENPNANLPNMVFLEEAL